VELQFRKRHLTEPFSRFSAVFSNHCAKARLGSLTRVLVLGLMAGLVAGCLRAGPMLGPVDEMLPDLPDSCGLFALSELRGQPMERLADFRLMGPLRVLWPGQEITNEIVPTRLNAEVDVTGRILRLICG
jgi:hypothetical protein